jgi:hypothetical protein
VSNCDLVLGEPESFLEAPEETMRPLRITKVRSPFVTAIEAGVQEQVWKFGKYLRKRQNRFEAKQ